MKKLWLLSALFWGFLLLAGCNNSVENLELIIDQPKTEIDADCDSSENTCNDEIETTDEWKTLVLYFSPTGNTKRVAEFISEIKESDITEIVPVEPYTEDDLNWRDDESRSFKEHEDTSIRPKLLIETTFDEYDTIYLGYPIWFGVTPNIILTLLDNYLEKITGKNIVLFCTSEHVWIEKSVEYLEPYNLNVKWSMRFTAETTKEEVQKWLDTL